jgi:hypothetical protein
MNALYLLKALVPLSRPLNSKKEDNKQLFIFLTYELITKWWKLPLISILPSPSNKKKTHAIELKNVVVLIFEKRF